jgi:hypothetical protein
MTTAPAPTTRLFRKLHEDGLLVLPNAWDAGSARVIERQGAAAIATTSAAVAWSHGYPDGNALPVPLLAATISEIVRVVRVPVTADIEGGYADTAAGVGETVAAVVEAGAVGINLEDGMSDPALLCVKIAAAKGAAGSARGGSVRQRSDGRRSAWTRARREPDRGGRSPGPSATGRPAPTASSSRDSRGRRDPDGGGSGAAAAERAGLARVADGRELEALGVRRLSAGSGIGQVGLRADRGAGRRLSDGRNGGAAGRGRDVPRRGQRPDGRWLTVSPTTRSGERTETIARVHRGVDPVDTASADHVIRGWSNRKAGGSAGPIGSTTPPHSGGPDRLWVR